MRNKLDGRVYAVKKIKLGTLNELENDKIKREVLRVLTDLSVLTFPVHLLLPRCACS